MAKGLQAAVAAAFLVFGAAFAQADETVSLKVGYQVLSPSGELAAEIDGIGTEVDLESDFDLGDSEEMVAELGISLGDFKISAAYMPLSFQGNSVLTRPILFDGELYGIGSPISSSVDLDIVDLGFTWYFLNMDDTPGRLQLGLELAAKITDAEASLNDGLTGRTETASATVPIPTVGLRGRVALADFAGVSGRFGYLGYGDNHFLDADLQVEISPLPLVGFYAGYRYLDIAIDESDIYVDSDFSGFYGGALIRF